MTASSKTPRPGVRRDRGLPARRLLAKAGMVAAMGALTWTALAGRRVLRRYHPLAGVALLGFSAWHLTLYQRRPPPKKT